MIKTGIVYKLPLVYNIDGSIIIPEVYKSKLKNIVTISRDDNLYLIFETSKNVTTKQLN